MFEMKARRASPAQVVEPGHAESRDYDYASNKCRKICGHYTQLVWVDHQSRRLRGSPQRPPRSLGLQLRPSRQLHRQAPVLRSSLFAAPQSAHSFVSRACSVARPSKTAEPSKKWLQPSLSQGAPFATRGQSGMSLIFSPRPLYPGVFRPIGARSSGRETLVVPRRHSWRRPDHRNLFWLLLRGYFLS